MSIKQIKTLEKKIVIPRSELFTDEGLNQSNIKKIIEHHSGTLISYYGALKDRFLGNGQAIHDREISDDKPNNKPVKNYSRILVEGETGFLLGNPVNYDIDNEELLKKIETFVETSDEHEHNVQLSTQCGIFGHSFELLYQDELGETKFVYIEPTEMIYIYDDTIQETPIMAIRYRNSKTIISGSTGVEQFTGTIYTDKMKYEFEMKASKITIGEPVLHKFNELPVIEYMQNEYRIGIIETVQSLEDTRNQALADKVNDLDYFSDAILVIMGLDLDEHIESSNGELDFKTNRILYAKGDENARTSDIKFIAKPTSDTTQENLLNRVESDIYEMAGIPNFNDVSFGTASGVALQMKLWRLGTTSALKESKFQAAMRRRLRLLLQQQNKKSIISNIKAFFSGVNGKKTSNADLTNLNIIFTPKTPTDKTEAVDTFNKIYGKVTDETAFRTIPSIVVDPVSEAAEIIKQRRQEDSGMETDWNDLNENDL